MSETSVNKAVRTKKRFKLLGWGIVISLLFGLFMWRVAPGLAETNCMAPTGYQEIGGIKAIDMDGIEFYVAKAIVPTGEGNGGMSVKIQGCTTEEDTLTPFGGIYVYIENNLIYIETGLRGEIIPLAEAPQP